jgi:hypothetical protein
MSFRIRDEKLMSTQSLLVNSLCALVNAGSRELVLL